MVEEIVSYLWRQFHSKHSLNQIGIEPYPEGFSPFLIAYEDIITRFAGFMEYIHLNIVNGDENEYSVQISEFTYFARISEEKRSLTLGTKFPKLDSYSPIELLLENISVDNIAYRSKTYDEKNSMVIERTIEPFMKLPSKIGAHFGLTAFDLPGYLLFQLGYENSKAPS